MRRVPVVLVLLALLSSAALTAQRERTDGPIEFVEIDAVVLDGKGRPLHGLTRADFSVKDAGKPVEIGTVSDVRGPIPDDPDSARTIVVLLDDSGVASLGTETVQIIARAVVASASPVDEVSVVRLHGRDDEPYGDRFTSEERIRAYRGSAWPFDYWSVTEAVLARVRDISRQVAANTARRKVVICIGSSPICNISQPRGSTPNSFDVTWRDAVSAAATANVAYYTIIPGRTGYRLDGLAEATGGEVFSTGSNVAVPIDRILQDGANHYVIGYFGAVSNGDRLRRVEVNTTVKGAKVHARRLR